MLAPRHLVLGLALVGCGAGRTGRTATTATSGPGSPFELVAEGPCGRLSVQEVGARTFLVYGETGYDLHDWTVGERLAAAQSFVELKDGHAYRVPALYAGLPRNAGGYVNADLYLGESGEGPWLLAVDTRYAPRPAGRLFDRRARVYERDADTWRSTEQESPVALPGAARSLPPLPVDTMCEKSELHFIPLTSTRLTSGHVLVAGRCQDQSHVNYRETTVLVAHGAPRATRWEIHRAPDVARIDGIVNLGLYARSPREAYLVAYEPFEDPDHRTPYLARWDGGEWTPMETGLPEGLMSIAGTEDGSLYVAGGRALYMKPRGGPFEPVTLPPLRYATEQRPATLRLHTVRVVGGDDVWVEGTYRVQVPGPKEPTEARASALFRLRREGRSSPALYCDAREPADGGLAEVE